MLLLDELKDVSLLITNSLKKFARGSYHYRPPRHSDLLCPNQYIAGLALSTAGTFALKFARFMLDAVAASARPRWRGIW